MSQSFSIFSSARRVLPGALALLATAGIGILAGVSGCSSSSSQSIDGGVGLVSGPDDMHCMGVDPIMVSQASCHPPADAGAPPDNTDGGEPEPETHFNGVADDDDCKYHVVWSSSPVAVNQPVTLSLMLTKLAENNAPASNADVVIEAALTDTPTHPIPNSGYKTTESPAGSGKYTITPLKFDETCEDKLEDSPHGHATFHYLVP
jgi:hypothetical protein